MAPQPDCTEDRAGLVIGGYWSMCAIATVVVGLRFWGRYMIRRVGADDIVMAFTNILFIILSSMVHHFASIGGIKHPDCINPPDRPEINRWNWMAQPFGILGFATGRLSIGLLVLRLMGPNNQWQRSIVFVAVGLCLLFNTLQCVFTFAQCIPTHHLWTKPPDTPGRNCWNPVVLPRLAYLITSWGILVDLAFTILPITILWGLRMKKSKKVGLGLLLGLSMGIATIIAIIKASFLSGLTKPGNTYDLFMWSGAELFVIIVCGSIPPIKPLYDTLFSKEKPVVRELIAKESRPYHLPLSSHELPFSEFRLIPTQHDQHSVDESMPRGKIRKHTQISVSYE